MSKTLSDLESTDLGPELKKDFERVATVIGKELTKLATTQTDMKTKLKEDIASMKKKVEAKNVTPEELGIAQSLVNQLVGQIQMANQAYEDIRKQQKSPFLEDTLKQLSDQSKEYSAILKEYQIQIDAGNKLVQPAVPARIDAVVKYARDNQVPKDGHTFTNLTAASQESGWMPTMVQVAGWVTGSRNLVETAGCTQTAAANLIGASSTLILYAISGFRSGHLGLLGSLAYGVGAVALSYTIPKVTKNFAVANQVAGPIVMGAYFMWGPGAIVALSSEALSQKIIIDRALNHNENIQKNLAGAQNYAGQIEQKNEVIQKTAGTTIERLTNATNHHDQALHELDEATKMLGRNPHIDNAAIEVRAAANDVQNARFEVVAVRQEANAANKLVGDLREQLVEAQGNATVLQHTLEQAQNPQRSTAKKTKDFVLGGAAFAVGQVAGAFGIPFADSLVAWGGSTVLGHGYTGVE
jgi:hypothetical protein